MKKKTNKKDIMRTIALVLVILLLAGMCALLGGCAPAESSSTSEKSKYAILRLPDDTIIQGNVDSTYTSSVGTIEIKINGVEYKTHWANVAIMESSK